MRKWLIALVIGAIVVAGAMILSAEQADRGGRVSYKGSDTAVAGARVTLRQPDQPAREVVANSKGEFTFTEREPAVVSVALAGYATSHRRWPPAPGSTVSIELEVAAAVSGTMVDATTLSPIAGNVTIIVEQPPHQTVSTSVEVGDNGYYSATDLPSGSAVVIASAEGYAPAFVSFDLLAGAARTEDLQLPTGLTLQGSVVDSSDNPVAGVEVSFEYQASSKGRSLMAGLIGGRAVTGTDGKFALTNLYPNETLRVWAEKDDSTTNVAMVFLSPTGTQDVVLRF